MKKRLYALLMVAAMIFLCACGSSGKKTVDSANKTEDKDSDKGTSDESDSGEIDINHTNTPLEKFVVEIKGESYDFPMTIQELSNKGWVVAEENDEYSLDEYVVGRYILADQGELFSFNNGSMKNIRFYVSNPSSDAQTDMIDCLVTGIMVDEKSEFSEGDIVFAGNITMQSSANDIYENLGKDFFMSTPAYADAAPEDMPGFQYAYNEDVNMMINYDREKHEIYQIQLFRAME